MAAEEARWWPVVEGHVPAVDVDAEGWAAVGHCSCGWSGGRRYASVIGGAEADVFFHLAEQL